MSRWKFILPILLTVAVGCSDPNPPILQNLNGHSWKLVNQDSVFIDFPGDFEGDILVTGYIFTHCQGICPAITANMKDISQKLHDKENVRFVGISFDPMRDTPSVLREYMERFELKRDLTGDSATVYSLFDEVGIRTSVIPDSAARKGAGGYSFKHTNQINLIDRQGRVRREYGGSMVPPQNVIEDVNRLLNKEE